MSGCEFFDAEAGTPHSPCGRPAVARVETYSRRWGATVLLACGEHAEWLRRDLEHLQLYIRVVPLLTRRSS